MVSKKSKLKLYWSIKRPIVTYACEAWVLKETIKNKLMVFEREVLRKMFLSYKRKRWYMENQNKRWIRWINKTQEYNKSHKSTKIKLVWPFTSNAGDRMVKKVYKWKPMLTRPLGRPKNRWEDDIRNDMKKLKIENWTSCIQDRNKWKLCAEKAKTFKEWSCSA